MGTMTQSVVAPGKDFLSILDLDAAELERCLEVAARLKADRTLGTQAPTADALSGRYVAMLFEKSSLRTRTTFEVGVRELGGRAIGLQPDVALGQRQAALEIARVEIENRQEILHRSSCMCHTVTSGNRR